MLDLLPVTLLILFSAGMLFSWIDWRRRAARLPKVVGQSWSCPHCALINEPELVVCWACGAGVAGRDGPAGTWLCRTCRAWNGSDRRTCWSCATAPQSGPRRLA